MKKKLITLSVFTIIFVMLTSVFSLFIGAAGTKPETGSVADAVNVKQLIDEIVKIQESDGGLTLEHKTQVEEARAAYEALSEEAKFLLEDYLPKLEDAEADIAELDKKPIELDPMNRDVIMASLNVLWKGLLAIFVVIAIIIIVVKVIQTVIIKISTPPEKKDEH